MPITPTAKIWMDGELVDWADATVHVLTHTLHYGTGVFEGIRCYATSRGPAVFRLREHMERFERSARLLDMSLPFGLDELVGAVVETVAASGLEECYIRPLAYLGYGEMGLNPIPCPVRVAVACWPWATYLGAEGIEKGIRLKVSSWARHDPRSLPTAAKGCGMYINSSLAKVEAVRAGYDEALMCTTDGYLAECTGENLFLVRRGRLVTPPSSAVGALAGITADAVTELARQQGLEVEEQLLRRSDLYLADEAFLTGTAAEVVPITSVDDRRIGSGRPGEITTSVQQGYYAAVRGEDDRFKDWLEYVR